MFKDKGLEKDLLEHFKHLKFVVLISNHDETSTLCAKHRLEVFFCGISKIAEKSLSEAGAKAGDFPIGWNTHKLFLSLLEIVLVHNFSNIKGWLKNSRIHLIKSSLTY